MATFRDIFFNRRIALMLPLGFASGLPSMLTADTLQAWGTRAGLSITTIGMLSLVSLPYTYKFLWAALIDRYAPPLLDRRRGWMILFQFLTALSMLLLALCRPASAFWPFFAAATCIAFFSASQDIATDAYRTDVLTESQRGSGTAMFVSGYRLAMILSGGMALILADKVKGPGLTWPTIYALMAAGMLIGVIATLWTETPPTADIRPPSLKEAVRDPLKQILTRRGGLLVIAFIILFKLPDVVAAGYTMNFMLSMHISESDIGWVKQIMGIGITILGALIGGVLVDRFGLRKCLWIFGFLQAASNAGFLLLAQYPHNFMVLVLTISVESFCGGLVTAGFTAFLMAQCDHRYTAFQFALLSSAMALTRIIGVAPSGPLVSIFGWPSFFLYTILLAIPGMAMLPFLPLHLPQPEDEGLATVGAESSKIELESSGQ